MSIVMMVGDSAAVVAAGGVFLDSGPVQAPVSSSGSSDYGTPGPEVAILFVGMSLCLGVLSRQLLRGTRVPYTVALLLLGIGLGSLEYGTKRGLGTLGDSIRMWAKINPSLILFIFLPALLFESSFYMDVHQIRRCLMQMLLLAAPGVLISTFFLGVVTKRIFPYDWNWSTALLLGGLLSATDPVAVVALLKELGASKKLSTLIEGESLMNDGTAIVVFQLFLQMVLGQKFDAGDVIEFLCRVALGALALGLAFGIVSVFWVGLVFNDTVIEITLTLTASYLAFFVAEDEAGVSGVLTVMTVGIFFAAFARTAFTGESEQSMHYFWEMISYIANTLIFLLSGVVIAESILRSQDQIQGQDWGYLAILYVFVQLSRVVVVALLYPGLKYFGYGLNWKEAAVLVWAGLRGAVALSLSLSVAQVGVDNSLDYHYISKVTEARFVFFTGGVVFLTLIINGSTTQFLVHYLNMDQISETKSRVLEYAKYDMYSKALESFEELGEDEELGPADWTTVCKYVSCLKRVPEEGRPAHPHHPPTSTALPEIEERMQQMLDTRIRFLNGVQSAYWTMLEEGRITQTAAILLMQSVDEAQDKVAKNEALSDWRGLRVHVHFPHYLKYLHWRSASSLSQKVSTFLLVTRLELACYISAAFLRAHRVTRDQLRAFIGESDVADAVIKESEEQEEHARHFLEDVRLAFPQVLRVVKTKQVTYAILLQLSEYVKSLEAGGLLESKETIHLHDAVQVDLKKLLRNPPLVEMPTAEETLMRQPFIGALPTSIRENLATAAKEFMKLRDSILYKEDAKPDGIWLIANGVVKWSNKAANGHRLLHPTFSHGSTLGLYETLTGKPFLCNIVADSVVHCFYIDRAKILSITLIHPELENFLWQESALAVAKIVLPQHFGVATLQELRILLVEGSKMCTFLQGEVFELQQSEVGVLLEGFVKQEGSSEILAAPAGLVFHNGEADPAAKDGRSKNLPHTGTIFHVEARSRILFFDVGISAEVLSRHSASRVSLSHLSMPRHSSHDHDTFLQRPSQARHSSAPRLRGPRQGSRGEMRGEGASVLQAWGSSSVLPTTAAEYVARAMRLSLFGSKVRGLSHSSRLESQARVSDWPINALSQSHSKLVKKMSYTVQENVDGDAPTLPRQRVFSQTNLALASPFVPLPILKVGRPSGDMSSDESDGEEHIVEIGSPSTLFHSHYLTPPTRPEKFLS